MNDKLTETVERAHFGDPCIYCGVGHDAVPPGPCAGDLWHCNCCRTEFQHLGADRPSCPCCKAFDQYTYRGPAKPWPALSLSNIDEGVTQEQAVRFLEHAFRNIDLPPLSSDDVADILDGLRDFVRAHRVAALRGSQS